MSKVKMSDIYYQSVTLVPVAECRGEIDPRDSTQSLVPCNWTWQPTAWGSEPGAAKKAAKSHVQYQPSHTVEVTARTISVYYVPGNLQP